jgi:hypothetical protein
VRFRHYDPTPGMCRWLERDPAGYQDGPSLYSYLGRNPMTGTDPFGLSFAGAGDAGGLVRNAVPGRAPVASMLQPIYDACSDLWDWVWGAAPAAVKLRGYLGAAAAVAQAAAGAALVAAGVVSAPAGVGVLLIVAGFALVLHAGDQLNASLKQIDTGVQQETLTHQLLKQSVGEEWADRIEFTIGAVSLVRGIMQIPKVLREGWGALWGLLNRNKCFLAGTLVLTAAPALAVPIESITEGAVVESVDPATGEPTPAVVTATPVTLFEGTIYDIAVDPGEPGGGDETTISATGEHPFLVARAGARATSLESRADPEAVALVEPLDTNDGRWVPARDLAEGDAVRTMSPQGVAGTATVAKVRARHAVAPVYNLTVRGTSRYLVGTCGVVVHNKEGVTVIGSGADVRAYQGRGFNVLNMDDLPPSEWPRQNALWLNDAIQRGDDIWLVTDPKKHAKLMKEVKKSSYYLDLELPMLEHYQGVNVIPMFPTRP